MTDKDPKVSNQSQFAELLKDYKTHLNNPTVITAGVIGIILLLLGIYFGIQNRPDIKININKDVSQELSSKVDRVTSENSDLVERINLLEREKNGLNERLDDLEEENSDLKDDNIDLKNELSNSQEINEINSIEIAEIKQINEKIKIEIEEKDQTIKVMQSELVSSSEEIDGFKSTMNENGSSLEKDIEINNMEKEISGLMEQAKEGEALTRNLQKEINDQESEITQLQDEIAELEFKTYQSGGNSGLSSITKAGIQDLRDKIRSSNKPTYPKEAKLNGTEGECFVLFRIDDLGKPYNVRANCTDKIFSRGTIRAVNNYSFEPGEYPLSKLTFAFNLND